jgi:hypothetical protein
MQCGSNKPIVQTITKTKMTEKKERSKPNKIPSKPVKIAQSRREQVTNSFVQNSSKKAVVVPDKKLHKGGLNKNKSKGTLGGTMKSEKSQVKNELLKTHNSSNNTHKMLNNRKDDSKIAEKRTKQFNVNPKKI